MNAARHFSLDEVFGSESISPGVGVACVELDRTGVLWIGTSGRGLLQFDGNHFYRPPFLAGLTNIYFQRVMQDRDGAMWLGTLQHGAIRVQDGRFKIYRASHGGLASDTVNQVFHDSRGALWFATDAGVSRFDNMNWITLTRRHGLPGNNVREIAEAPTGEMWFTTDRGAARYVRQMRSPSSPAFYRRTATGREALDPFMPRVLEEGARRTSDRLLKVELGTPQTIEWDLADFTTPGEQRVFRQFLRSGRFAASAVASQPGWTTVIGRQFHNWTPDQRGAWTLAVQFVDRDGNVSAPALVGFEVFVPW